MGLFLALTGIAGADLAAVESALRAFARDRGGSMEATPSDDQEDRLVIAKSAAGNITVVYPSDFMGWDDASRYLSETLGATTISLHIHDEDLWMYILFDAGNAVDWFNPLPGYWGKVSSGEHTQWAGNADVVARHWPNLSADAIRNYLVAWDLDDDSEERAYPEDEFGRGHCWQLVDFMNKLQLIYPDDGRAAAAFEFNA